MNYAQMQPEMPISGPGVSDDREAVLRLKRPVIPVGIAAAVLDVSRQRVYDLVEKGELETVLIFGSLFVYVSSVRRRLSLSRRLKSRRVLLR